MFTDFLDALPQVEVDGTQEVQGVQAEVTADVVEEDGPPRRSNRLKMRTLAREVSRNPSHEFSGTASAE